MDPIILNVTLGIIIALESSGGLNTDHPVIENPRSIHYGTQALGIYGIMPATLRELNVGMNDAKGAKKLATAILRRNGGCPLQTAVISWEQGQNLKVQAKHWTRGTAPLRLEKALKLWKGPIKNRTKAAGRSFYENRR